MTLRDVYERAKQERFPEIREVVQFRSLGCLGQYAVPFDQTLRYVPAHSRVLDWGFGGGHWSYTLREMGHCVDAFGLWREEGFTRCLESGPRFSLTIGSTSEPCLIPYESNTFDAVYSIGVLEHVRETGGSEVASMAEIKRVLKPGGHFICAHFPNKRSWIEKIPSKGFKHQFLYAKADVERFCEESGLELVELKLYNVLPRRILNRLPGKDSQVVASLYNGLDSACGLLMRPFAQNWGFVSRKA